MDKDKGLNIILTCSQWLNYEGHRSTWSSQMAFDLRFEHILALN